MPDQDAPIAPATPPLPPTSAPVGAESESFPSKPSSVALEKLAEIAFHAHNATYREGDTIDPERVQELLNDTELAAWLKTFRDRSYPWRWKYVGPR